MKSEKVQERMTNSIIGKRKTSIAKVFLKPGSGNIFINQKTFATFFSAIGDEKELIKKPFLILNLSTQFDTFVKVKGGGISSQLDAISLGIAKALSKLDRNYRQSLSQNGYLRRDSRIKERRKYGLKKARKASQYSKR